MPLRTVKSSIAGVIAHIVVVEGTRVTRDQAVVMIEIMKMEIAAESPVDGVVMSIFVKPGDTIQEGQPLFSLET
jgi:biotin carboxyl carrier protein